MARFSAFVAAVLMIVAALVYRDVIDLPGGGSGSGGGGDEPGSNTFVCASELGDVCESAGADVVEPAMETADRLIEVARPDQAGVSAWLVPGPWPQMVDAVRRLEQKAPIFAETEALARSPLVVLVRDAGARALGDCNEWACIGDAAIAGSLRLGAPASADPIGLLVRGVAQAGHAGTTDFAIDITDDGWISSLNRELDQVADRGASTTHRFLTTQGSADAFATTDAEAGSIGVPKTVRVIIPKPVAVVTLTLGLRPGADAPEVDHRWPDAPPSLPKTDGLPSTDVLYALRDLF